MAAPDAIARRIVRSMTTGSPAWKPHAMLTDVTSGMSAASWPIGQGPKLSPTSALRSMGDERPVMTVTA